MIQLASQMLKMNLTTNAKSSPSSTTRILYLWLLPLKVVTVFSFPLTVFFRFELNHSRTLFQGRVGDVHWKYGCFQNPSSTILRQGKNQQVQNFFKFKAIASGLEYLHSRSILHNDIKAENVIIGVDNLPKLTDFGNSRLLIDDEPEMLLTGTPESLSPEMITSQGEISTWFLIKTRFISGYSFPRDWWSFGVLVYQMISKFKACFWSSKQVNLSLDDGVLNT